jgi:hypothetical protein
MDKALTVVIHDQNAYAERKYDNVKKMEMFNVSWFLNLINYKHLTAAHFEST